MDLSQNERNLIASLPARVRQTAPLVHCLTNLVVSNFTANTLLALGASPAMVTAAEETEEFAQIADALLVNLGTIDSQQLLSIRFAVSGANRAGKPWVLDPITAGLAFRTSAAQSLLTKNPTVIRGNASEIMALASSNNVKIKGADSLARSEEALGSAVALAKTNNTVVAISGESDYITDGFRIITLQGGHPLMTRVTGVGCALNAAIAAFVVAANDPFLGTIAAMLAFSRAGEKAAKAAIGPGSFAVAFIDHLSLLTPLSFSSGECS